MSIRPVRFNADGSIDVLHDDAPGGAHAGTLPVVALVSPFLQTAGTAADHRYISLPCPVVGCGFVTLHPIGGGAAPAIVQELFVRIVRRIGCPCGQVPAGRPIPVIQAHIKLEAERMDGVGRWAAGILT